MRQAKCLVLLLFAVSLASLAMGQLANTTSIVGTVTDSSGAVIPGVRVSAVNMATQDTYTGISNGAGNFSLQFIRIGTYAITATVRGFKTASHTGVIVQTDQTVRVDFVLQVGQVSQRIVVSGAPPPIATDNASISQIVNQRQITQLPLNGRDALQLAVTTPGVLNGLISNGPEYSGVNPGEMFIGAGTREIDNEVSLDGVTIMSNLLGEADYHPSVDAVQELSIQTGTYPAQYGNYQGVHINVITKSGTNEVHGTAYEFVRNDALDARGFFEDPAFSKFPYHLNQFGGEIGGPVVLPHIYTGKDKTFFMVDYEGLRQVSATAALTTVLTPEMEQGNFSQVSTTITNPLLPGQPAFSGNQIPQTDISPQALNLLKYMPLPNVPGITNNYLAAVALNNSWDQVLARVDQNVGEKTRLFFRLAWFDSGQLVGATNPFSVYNNPDNNRNYAIGWTQMVSPDTVNDFHFGYQHVSNYTANIFYNTPQAEVCTTLGIPGLTCSGLSAGLPNVSISGFSAIGAGDTNWFENNSTWQGTDVFNDTRGNHGISTGVEIFKFITDRAANNGPRGTISFTGQLSGYAPADLLLGLPFSYTTPGPELFGDYAAYRYSLFGLDKWQATHNLTLNIGLRYELPTVPESTNGIYRLLNAAQTAFIPPTPKQIIPLYNGNHTDFAPRFGFAYRIKSNWVVRGGWGLYYGPDDVSPRTLLTTNPPFSTIFTYQDTLNAPTPALSLTNLTPSTAQAPAPPENAVTFNPYFPTPTMTQWSFDGERALWRNAGLDVQYMGSHSYNLDTSWYNNTPLPGPGVVQARRPNQLFGTIRTFVDSTIGNYDALNIVLTQRTSHGLTMNMFYTWSHTLDEGYNATSGGAPVNPYDFRADYGNSNWDVRNRFVASIVYALPFLTHSAPPWLRGPLGNWEVSDITTIQSGLPFDVTIPTDVANTGRSDERPNLVGSVIPANCGSGHLQGCIPASPFAMPALYTYGNAAPNLLFGPGLSNTDFALMKNIHLSERANLQIRGEFFNFFNTPYFASPNAVFGTAPFGTVTSTAADNREIQLAAKLTW